MTSGVQNSWQQVCEDNVWAFGWDMGLQRGTKGEEGGQDLSADISASFGTKRQEHKTDLR